MLRVSVSRVHLTTVSLLVSVVLATSALAQNLVPVDWNVTVKGELLIVDVKTSAGQPEQRMNPSPSYLELVFPKAKQTSAAGTRAIDKGLVQKVQTLQDADTTVMRVYVLTKPKASLSKTAEGYRYTVRLNQMADAPPVASVPAAEPASSSTTTGTEAGAPTAVKTVAVTPPSPPKEPVKTVTPTPPTPPKETTKTVAATTPTPPKETAKTVAATTPTATSGGADPKKKINIVFQNQPLAQALQMLATQAGYSAQIDSKVSGVVNLSLAEIPFDDALGLLLDPMQSSLSYELRGQTLVVISKNTSVATSAPTAPIADNDTVIEYFPFSTKDAQKVADAARKAVPELSYRVDPALNILMVQGPRADVERLEQILKSMSKK